MPMKVSTKLYLGHDFDNNIKDGVVKILAVTENAGRRDEEMGLFIEEVRRQVLSAYSMGVSRGLEKQLNIKRVIREMAKEETDG